MEDIEIRQTQLPDTLSELAQFVLVGRERLQSVRAAIRAIDKLGLAKEVRQQKLKEGQEIANAVTDAEVKIGELLEETPKATKDNNPSGKAKTQFQPELNLGSKKKSDVLEELGINRQAASEFQRMARHPESVAKAKEIAKENDDILSRKAVLRQIEEDARKDFKEKHPTREQYNAQVAESIAEQEQALEEAEIPSIADIRKLKDDKAYLKEQHALEVDKAIWNVEKMTKVLDKYTDEEIIEAGRWERMLDSLDSLKLSLLRIQKSAVRVMGLLEKGFNEGRKK